MMYKCGCMNVTHNTPICRNEASLRCDDCGETLCKACAKRHHFHDKFSKIIRPGKS